MPNKNDTTTNILPHNPMKANNIFDHVKQLKGDMKWFEFDLRCILAKYPDDKVVAKALEEVTKPKEAPAPTPAAEEQAPAPTPEPTPEPEPEKPATTGKGISNPATSRRKKKTLAEVQAANEKGSALMPTEAEVAELNELR